MGMKQKHDHSTTDQERYAINRSMGTILVKGACFAAVYRA
jgi:hypothetical protein